MDTDIRKPDTGTVTIGRPTPVASNQNTDSTTTPDYGPYSPPAHRAIPYTEPISEGEEDEEMAIAIPVNEVGSVRVPLSEGLEAIAFREKELKHQEAEADAKVAQRQREAQSSSSRANGAKRQPAGKDKAVVPTGRLAIDPLATSNAFDQSLQKKLKASAEDGEPENNNNGNAPGPSRTTEHGNVQLIRDFIASPGKRIAVPVRIEPKVFFAQERTFLVSNEFRFISHLKLDTHVAANIEMASFWCFDWNRRHCTSQFLRA